jgi:hypothetical protein
VARLDDVEATVWQALDQLPTTYCAGTCNEDAAGRLRTLIEQIREVADTLTELQGHIEY